jgi:hypothetical protein
MPERALDPEELAAIRQMEIDQAIAQARQAQRVRDIQARRPGFQTLMGYGAKQINPISQVRSSQAAMGEAGRRLESPIYERYIGDKISGAANVQAPVSLARELMAGTPTTPEAPAAPPPLIVTPAATSPAAAAPTQMAPSAVGGMYDEFNQAAPVYSGPPMPSAVQRAVQVARQSAGVPVPPQRPDSLAPQPPSAEAAMAARTNAVRDAWTRYNETGSAADFVRASALMQANMPERQQEADGGSIKAKSAAKPDPVHKALEIIHHLLVHGR